MSVEPTTKKQRHAHHNTKANSKTFEATEQEYGNNVITLDKQVVNDLAEDEQNQQSSTRQRRHGHKKKRRGATKDIDPQNEHTLQAAGNDVEFKGDDLQKFDEQDPNWDGNEATNQDFVILEVEDGHVEENKRPSEIVNEITKDVDLLANYSAEPLLTLVEACAPLENILHDLSVYVQMALEETPQEPPDGLTIDESAAVRLYSIEWEKPHRSLYSMLNYTLKMTDRENIRPYFRYLKLFLTALVKIPCSPPLTVWRGVTKNLSADFPPGTPVIWWAFTSCTVELTVLENNMYLGNTGARTLFSVEAINGRTIRPHSHFVTEEEILLLPGTYMEVQSLFSPAADMYIIHLKQMKPPVLLLEPPFEGANVYAPEPIKTPWYKKKKNIFQLSLLLVICLAGLIVGVVLGTRHGPPPPICIPRKFGIRADLLWSFDCGDSREDLKRLNNGTGIHGVTYTSPDLSGKGKALNLNRKLKQYVVLPQSLNLTMHPSYTMSLWLSVNGYKAQTMLSDCDTSGPICVAFNINRGVNLTQSNTTKSNATFLAYETPPENVTVIRSSWVHLTVLFDNQTQRFSLYTHGVRTDLSFSNSSQLNPQDPQGIRINQNHVSYIGLNLMNNLQYLSGAIDQLSVAYFVKNDSEILNEATLVCHYTFDTVDINADSGPNSVEAHSQHVYQSVLNNSSNQSSLLFNSSDSFFQTSNLPLVNSDGYDFSFAFWLRLSNLLNSDPFIATPILQIAIQIAGTSSNSYDCLLTVSLLGYSISFDFPELAIELDTFDKYEVKNDTWLHLGMSYANGSKLSFYLNGQLADTEDDASTVSSLFYAVPRLFMTFGSQYSNATPGVELDESMQCFPDVADSPLSIDGYAQMTGKIDDFILYSRALANSEFAALYNNTPAYH